MLREYSFVRNVPRRENVAVAEGTGVGRQGKVSRTSKDSAEKRSARSTSTRGSADDEQDAHSRLAVLLQYSLPCMHRLYLCKLSQDSHAPCAVMQDALHPAQSAS